MTNQIGIYEHTTGKQIVREMTIEEQAERDALIQQIAFSKQAEQEAEEAAWRIKVSAYEKLGLTSEEITALAPTPEWLVS